MNELQNHFWMRKHLTFVFKMIPLSLKEGLQSSLTCPSDYSTWIIHACLSKLTPSISFGFGWKKYTCSWIYSATGRVLIKALFYKLLPQRGFNACLHSQAYTFMMTHAGFNVISMFCLSALPEDMPVDSFRSCILQFYEKWVFRRITGQKAFTNGLIEMYFWVLVDQIANSLLAELQSSKLCIKVMLRATTTTYALESRLKILSQSTTLPLLIYLSLF